MRYLGIRIEDDEEMRPLQALTSVPYAVRAESADNPDGVFVAGQQLVNADGEWVGASLGGIGSDGVDGTDGSAGPAGERGSIGPAGLAGSTGARGPIGPAGTFNPENCVLVQNDFPPPQFQSFSEAAATCTGGRTLVGGGCFCNSFGAIVTVNNSPNPFVPTPGYAASATTPWAT